MPITNPSHASMLTGLYPANHGAVTFGLRIKNDVPTVALLLAGSGYRTGAFVSGFSLAAPVSGLERGFEIYEDDWPKEAAERRGDQTARIALNWLRDIPDTQPVFLWLHLFDPHKPYDPPDIFGRRREAGYRQSSGDAVRGQMVMAQHDPAVRHTALMEDDGEERAEGSMPPERVLREWNRYLGEIEFTDREISLFMRRFARLRPGRPRVVMLTSDHGESFSHGYYFRHIDRLYQTLLHVPLVVCGPGQPRRIDPLLRQSVDIAPTMLHLAGLSVPAGLDGKPLFLMKDSAIAEAAGHAAAFAQLPGRSSSLSLGPLFSAITLSQKLVYHERTGETAAYDLVADPGELAPQSGAVDSSWEELRRILTEYQQQAAAGASAAPQLDEESLETFRRLGYVQ